MLVIQRSNALSCFAFGTYGIGRLRPFFFFTTVAEFVYLNQALGRLVAISRFLSPLFLFYNIQQAGIIYSVAQLFFRHQTDRHSPCPTLQGKKYLKATVLRAELVAFVTPEELAGCCCTIIIRTLLFA